MKRNCKKCGKLTKSDRHCFCDSTCRHDFYYAVHSCLNCGKNYEYSINKPTIYCSIICFVKNKDVINRMKLSRKKCFQEKYGVDAYTQTEEFKNSAKKTNLEKYGIEYPQQSKEIREKSKQTNLEKYGVDNPGKSKKIKEQIKQTNFNKYGNRDYVNVEKCKETKKLKYGNEKYNNVEKNKETCLNKYGVDNPSKYPEIMDKIKSHLGDYYYDKLIKNTKITDVVDICFDRGEYKNTYKNNLYKFRCKKCNNEFFDNLSAGKVPKCLICYPPSISKPQQEIYDFIRTLNNDIDIVQNSRKIIHPFEIDIYLPSIKLAIEFNGNRWHSENIGGKDKNYHLNKTNRCEDKGITLLHIFEDEWNDHKEDIKNIIRSNIIIDQYDGGYDNIKELGNKDVKVDLGLYDNDNKLIAILTIDDKDEIINFTSTINNFEIYSKLFNYYINNYAALKITINRDRKYFNKNNDFLYKLGFNFSNIMPPTNYIIKETKKKSYKIWDCGYIKYKWVRSSGVDINGVMI